MFRKLAFLLLGVAALTTMAAAPSLAAVKTPPPPLTFVTDISYSGAGHYLSACANIGAIVYFKTPSGCNDNGWYAQLEGTSGGKYYYWHPRNNTNLCLTASTTQEGVIKIEACVGADNQWWWNPNNGYSIYHLTSFYYDEYLTDPTGVNGVQANLTNGGNCAFGNNGCSLLQG